MKQCLNVKYQYRYNVRKNITAKYSYLTVEKKNLQQIIIRTDVNV